MISVCLKSCLKQMVIRSTTNNHSKARLRALCFHLMYSFEADNEGDESEGFVSCERSAVAAACDLLATPLGILNKHINQKTLRSESNGS